MKKAIVLLVLTLATTAAFAQKVKIKKDVVLIDEVETYKIEKAGSVQILSDLTGKKEFVAINSDTYKDDEEAVEIKIGNQNYVYTYRFLVSGKMLYTDVRTKDMIAKIYKANMVDANGNVDETKLDDFINKYSNPQLKNKL